MTTGSPDMIQGDRNEILISIFRTAAVGIGMVINRVIIEVNDTMCEMTGYTRDELTGTTSRILYPDEADYDYVGFEKYRQIREYGRGTVETRWRRKDGAIINILLSSSALDPVNLEKGITFTAIDITQMKTAEQALAASEARYRELVELAVDGILLASPDASIISMNSQLERMTCRHREELTGHHVSELFTAESLAEKPLHLDLLARGETVISERVLKRPDGIRVTVETHTKMMPDGVFQSIFRDVTERIRLTESLQRSRKLDSLATLSAGIAHDFNNILGGMLGYIDLARSFSRAGRDAAQYLDKAMMIIDRARNLTGQLMTFARGGVPSIKTADITPVLKKYTESALTGSRITCRYEIADDLWPGDFDENQIGQVIYNLVSNSRDFTDAGGGIVVRAVNAAPGELPGHAGDGRYIRISVIDSGKGIQPDILPYIFDPFYSTKKKGNGLGLSTSYSIIQRHGGMLEVEPLPEGGTMAWFCLPASSEPVMAMPEGDSPCYEHHGTGTILIMDDEPFLREIITRMLEFMGYGVIQASDGSEVLEKLCGCGGESPLKCVILDLTVPGGMGGRETVREMLRMNIGVPVFASSGYSVDAVMSDPGKYGFTDSIRKPFTMDDLSRLLNRYIGQDSQSAIPSRSNV